MSFNTLNFEQVNMLHSNSIEEFGGLPGRLPDTQERVESSLAQIEKVFGYDRYSSIEEKASALLYFFAKNHCYRDGNKRIAFSICDIFLFLNGKDLTLPEDEAIKLVLEVAESDKRGQEIESYIKEDIAIKIKKNCIDI